MVHEYKVAGLSDPREDPPLSPREALQECTSRRPRRMLKKRKEKEEEKKGAGVVVNPHEITRSQRIFSEMVNSPIRK